MFKDSKAFSSFSVDDIAKAKEFYGQKLGLDVTEQPGMGLSIKFADGGETFIYPKDNHAAATFTVLNFLVDDLQKAIDDLTNLGIEFEHYDNMNQDEKGIAHGLDTGEGPDVAWFKDPAGNVVSVLQES